MTPKLIGTGLEIGQDVVVRIGEDGPDGRELVEVAVGEMDRRLVLDGIGHAQPGRDARS